MSKRWLLLVLSGAAALFGTGLLFGTALAATSPPGVTRTVYDAIPNPLPPNVVSLGFQSDHAAEFGDYVHLAGTARRLSSVTVTMSDHALYSDYSSDPRYSGNSASWTHPITINIYTNHLDANGVPDQKIASKTQTVTIPWRPPNSPYTGIAFNASFDMKSLNVTLPNAVIVTVAFNTWIFGYSPIGVNGPYISLNVGAPDGGTATVGTDDNPDHVFLNAERAPYYANGCPGGVVGQLCEDSGWAPNGTLPFRIQASACPETCTPTAARPRRPAR